MSTLTRLERRILAVLEEAGEEQMPTLTNTVARPRGGPEEIDAMSRALLNLHANGYVELAVTRPGDESGGRAPLSGEDVITLLQGLPGCFRWSPEDQAWRWQDELSRAEVLLTNAGVAMSGSILAEDGWPAQPLENYEQVYAWRRPRHHK